MTYLITGMFNSQEVDTIEDARAIVQFAYDRRVESEAYLFQVQCRYIVDGTSFRTENVPPETLPEPVADEYGAFNTQTGVYDIYQTFAEAKAAVEAFRQSRADTLMATHTISAVVYNPETSQEEWAVVERMPFVPSRVPKTVSRFQALAVLAAGGYLSTVRTYIATLSEDNITRLAFENATEWERTSPTVNALAQMLGLTDTQVDDLFIAASQVSA